MNYSLLYVNFFYFGIFLTMSLLHLAILIGKKRDKRNLACFMYGISLSLILLLFQIIYVFYPFPHRIPYIFAIFLLVIFLCYFMESVFDISRSKKVLFVLKIGFFVFCLLISVVITVSSSSSSSSVVYSMFNYGVMFFISVYFFFLLFNIIKKRQYRNLTRFWVILSIIPVIVSICSMLFLGFPGATAGNEVAGFIPQYTGSLLMMLFFTYALVLQNKEDEERLAELTQNMEREVEERIKAGRFCSEKLKIERIKQFCTHHKLSDRECQIIDLILSGKKNKEIGIILYISESTVKTYAKRIYQKTDTKDRFDLVSKMQNI